MVRKKKTIQAQKIEADIFEIKLAQMREELAKEEKRMARLDLQEKALLALVRNGLAKRHTVSVEVIPDARGNRRKRSFTFYKLQVQDDDTQRNILPQEQLLTGYQ